MIGLTPIVGVAASPRAAWLAWLASLACLLACLVGGCVLPIAPEFETERNAPPFTVDVRPLTGSVLTDPNAFFDVVVRDPNSTDTLHARWLIDYPPYNPEVTRSLTVTVAPPGPGRDNLHRIAFQPRCADHRISPSLTRHQLLLLVSDRAFVDKDVTRPEETPSDAFVVRLSWTFDQDCSRP